MTDTTTQALDAFHDGLVALLETTTEGPIQVDEMQIVLTDKGGLPERRTYWLEPGVRGLHHD